MTNSSAKVGSTPWLAYYSPDPKANLRLFCFPYAGSGASIFRTWQDSLANFIEVLPVNLPGRGSRMQEPPFTRLIPLVQAIAEGLLSYFDKPFAFFGHSMGALVSFELARYLRRNYSLEPIHLIVSGRMAPHLISKEPPYYNLPDEEFIEKLRDLKGTPVEAFEEPELMQLMLPVIRSDFEAIQTYVYRPEPPLNCDLTAFGGRDDNHVLPEELESWEEHSAFSFKMWMFPGDHFFINTVRMQLLSMISLELSRRQGGRS